jgi:hypothetical protein
MEISSGAVLHAGPPAMLLQQTEDGVVNSVDDGIAARAVIRQVQEELRQLLRQRSDLKRRIATVKKTVAGLACLFGESTLREDLKEFLDRGKASHKKGFTNICRAILIEAKTPITIRELCDRMRERDPALIERHKDPIASATTVLNRLVKYGEAHRVTLVGNKNSWQWASKSRAGSLS